MTVPHDDTPHKPLPVLQSPTGTTCPPAALGLCPDHDVQPGPTPEPCPRCGVIDAPLLGPGSGPHACKASCAHCGRFLRWVSLLAPSERMAHRRQARLQAMQAHPASMAQLSLLLALGDTQAAPSDMAEASERIERLKAATEAKRSNAPGWRP